MVNVGSVLDKAMTKFTISGAAIREKAVGWFNEVARDISDQPRTWELLSTIAALDVADNQATIPQGEIIYLKGDTFVLTPADQMSEQAAFDYIQNLYSTTDTPIPVGYTLDAGNNLTFVPSLADGTVSAKITQTISEDYLDETETIFPDAFENLFVIGVRMHYYDSDQDIRYPAEFVKYYQEMKKLKEKDNRLKAKPSVSPHGYTRSK